MGHSDYRFDAETLGGHVLQRAEVCPDSVVHLFHQFGVPLGFNPTPEVGVTD